MTDQTLNKSRRNALKFAIGAAVVVPLGGLLSSKSVLAADLPQVDPASPAAVGLKYVHDATKATRADKPGTPGANQTCANCQLALSTEGDWVPCSIFPGKSVSSKGWCSAWIKRAG